MTKTDKAINWARSLAAEAPVNASDLVETVKRKASHLTAAANDGWSGMTHGRWSRREAAPTVRSASTDLVDAMRRNAANLSAQHRWSHVAPSGRRPGLPVAAVVTGVAGGLLLGLAVAELMRRRKLRAQEADVGTYFSHQDTPHAGAAVFDSSEEAWLAQGAGFEDVSGGEQTPVFGTERPA